MSSSSALAEIPLRFQSFLIVSVPIVVRAQDHRKLELETKIERLTADLARWGDSQSCRPLVCLLSAYACACMLRPGRAAERGGTRPERARARASSRRGTILSFLSRGGCQSRRHSLVDCDHGDSITNDSDGEPARPAAGARS
jgi:hypothetical protein